MKSGPRTISTPRRRRIVAWTATYWPKNAIFLSHFLFTPSLRGDPSNVWMNKIKNTNDEIMRTVKDF